MPNPNNPSDPPVQPRPAGAKRPSTGRGPYRKRPSPRNPVQIGHMLHEMIEIAPHLLYPLEVLTGSRALDHPNESAVIDVEDKDTGEQYLILVIRRKSSFPSSTRASLRLLEGNETSAKESGSSGSSS